MNFEFQEGILNTYKQFTFKYQKNFSDPKYLQYPLLAVHITELIITSCDQDWLSREANTLNIYPVWHWIFPALI